MRNLLTNCTTKKGPAVWSWAISHPGKRCPFATSICARWCYAQAGQFPLHEERYVENYEFTKSPDFAATMLAELDWIAGRSKSLAYVCLHEKGDFYDLQYLRAWGSVIRRAQEHPNLRVYGQQGIKEREVMPFWAHLPASRTFGVLEPVGVDHHRI